jgi:hypothetical protein
MSEPVINTQRPGRSGRKFLFISLLVIIAIAVIAYFICGITYSDGTRSGILTKVSRKGFVFKTFEGEINIGGLNQGDGTIMPATVFKFSAENEQVYRKLESMQGRKVVVHYREVIKNLFWQGDTNYFVYDANLASVTQ